MTVCPVKAISLDWATEMVPFMERLTEYAYGAVKGRGKRVCYINFVLNVTPDCDCVGWSDLPLVPDVGLLASTDPVALDQACLDMVNARPGWIPLSTALRTFLVARWPHTRGEVQLSYGQSLGLGNREYVLKKI